MPLVLLGLLVVEATIYADENTLPRSLFHPGSGSTQLRLPEIYITLALVARLIARGKPTRIGLPAGLWLAFAGLDGGRRGGGGAVPQRVLAGPLRGQGHPLHRRGLRAGRGGVPVRRYLDSGDLFKLGTLWRRVRVRRWTS